jgi:hypothetical protein
MRRPREDWAGDIAWYSQFVSTYIPSCETSTRRAQLTAASGIFKDVRTRFRFAHSQRHGRTLNPSHRYQFSTNMFDGTPSLRYMATLAHALSQSEFRGHSKYSNERCTFDIISNG